MITIRPANSQDIDAIWAILKPIFRAGDTYAIDQDITQNAAIAFWAKGTHSAFVAHDAQNQILGTYYICANQQGGGRHVCNCGFATAQGAQGQGIAQHMLTHALATARQSNYEAMQFNFVVESNAAALKIWHKAGFAEVGRLPNAFRHPKRGPTDALILYKSL